MANESMERLGERSERYLERAKKRNLASFCMHCEVEKVITGGGLTIYRAAGNLSVFGSFEFIPKWQQKFTLSVEWREGFDQDPNVLMQGTDHDQPFARQIGPREFEWVATVLDNKFETPDLQIVQ